MKVLPNLLIFYSFIFLFGVWFKGVFIVGAKRTAFGALGGTLKSVTGTQLQAHASKATLEAAGVRPDQVDTIIIGNVLSVCIISWSKIPPHFFPITISLNAGI